MKYCLKNTTSSTIWKKILMDSPATSAKPSNTANTTQKSTNSYVSPVKSYGVKLATWSRNFDFKPFKQVKRTSLVLNAN